MKSVRIDLIFVGTIVIGFFFFQAEDGIRDFCLSRGLGDVYKRQKMVYDKGSSSMDYSNRMTGLYGICPPAM